MMVLDAIVAGAFFVGGLITGAALVVAAAFSAWCFQWPRWLWK